MMWRFELGLTLLFLQFFKQLLSFLFRCRVSDFVQTGVQLQKLINSKFNFFTESANVLPASQHGSMFLIECNMRTLLLTCETNSVCISIPICESLRIRSCNVIGLYIQHRYEQGDDVHFVFQICLLPSRWQFFMHIHRWHKSMIYYDSDFLFIKIKGLPAITTRC